MKKLSFPQSLHKFGGFSFPLLLSFAMCLLFLGTTNVNGQSIFVTTGGGSFPGEMWISITTGADGTGTVVYAQGNGTLGNSAGALTDVEVDVSAYAGTTLYLNAYDQYGDTWNGGTYLIEETASGPTIISGAPADDGVSGTSGWDGPPEDELEESIPFTAPSPPCTQPTVTYTIVPDCGNGQFSIDVNVTTNDASGVNISDDDASTSYSFTNVGDGISVMGPYTAGTNVIITVDGTPYGCATAGSDSPSGTLTEACACTTTPTASINSNNLDCGAGTFDIEVTVTSDGSGDANMTDILIDGVVVQADATVGQLYTFNQPVNTYSVTVEAEGASFVTCSSASTSVSESCTNLDCSSAFNVPTDGTAVTTTPIPNSSTTYESTSCDSSGNEETWFRFTAPNSGIVSLTIDNYTDTFDNLDWAIFSGACGALTEVSCGTGNTATPVSAEIISGLTGGSTYYIQTSQDNGDGAATFDVSLTSPISDIAANTSTCWDLSTAPTLFDLGDAGDDYACGFGFEYSGSTDDHVAYIYTPATSETVDLVIDNVTSSTDFAVAIFDNTVGTPVNCLAGGEANADITFSNISLTGGTSYIIIIGSQVNNQTSSGCVTVKQQCNTVYTSTVTANCAGNTYSVDLNFSSLGIANTVDITDGTTTYNAISTATNYTFNFTDVGPKTITVTGFDAGAALLCEEQIAIASPCNGSDDFSTSAPNILGTCTTGGFPGDLSVATAGLAQGFTGGCNDNLGVSGSTGNNVIRDCSAANFDNNTNWVDLWYQVDLPDGGDEMTIEVTGLNAGEIVGFSLHTGDPGTDAGNTQVFSSNSNDCSFFDNNITSQTITGLAAASTAPIYIRILSIAFDDGAGCAAIINPTFNICASAPQANDVCNSAINITTNNLIDTGVASTGDLSAASDEGNSIDCAGTSITGADLWYEVLYPDVPSVIQSFNTELYLTGQQGDQYIINVFGVTDACGSAGVAADMDYCELITLTGGTDVTTLGDITSTDGQSREIQIIAVNATGPVTVEANVVYENNVCEPLTSPGSTSLNIQNPQEVDFNYASNPTLLGQFDVFPQALGDDLWYYFDPQSNSADGFPTYSTSAEITVSGLDSGEELTFYVYKGDSYATTCDNLIDKYLCSVEVTNNTSISPKSIDCLDHCHGGRGVDGGYMVRIVQTAGSTIANPTVTITPEASIAGPANNDCIGDGCIASIWDGNGPGIFPADNPNSDAAHNWNQFWLQDGDILSDSFVGANDSGFNSECGGIDLTADRDLWYVFCVPDNECGTTGLTQSTVYENMKITYDASNQFHDAYAFVYDGCVDADCGENSPGLVDCSGSLDGEGETWTVSNLKQGECYLLRIKPDAISTSDYDFSFTIQVNNGDASPCNDYKENAEGLAVNTGCSTTPWYPSLETYTALGANDEETFGENDVFFSFIAPTPANGGPYFDPYKSWVTVFLESVSGHNITMELCWKNQTVATAEVYSVSGSGDKIWARFGHLYPGEEYQIRLRHNQTVTTDVQYKIRVESGDNNPLTECDGGTTSLTPVLCGSCGGENGTPYLTDPVVSSLSSTGANNHCEIWYKIDLPTMAGGTGTYWVVEVEGYEQILDFELRSQYITESGNTHGGQDDYDHPCSSDELGNGSFVSSYPVTYELTGPSTYSSIMLNAMGSNPTECTVGCTAAQGTSQGGGFRKVYRDVLGPASGMKNYLYLRVFMDENDPNYTGCRDGSVMIDPANVIFRGPYSSDPTDGIDQTTNAPGAPDLTCAASTCAISNVAVAVDGNCVDNDATFELSFDVVDGSGLYEVFVTSGDANIGIAAGDVLGVVSGASTGSLNFTTTIPLTTSDGVISVNVREGGTSCQGTPVNINVPLCAPCDADAGDITNTSDVSDELIVCVGNDLFNTDGTTEVVFTTDYTATDENEPSTITTVQDGVPTDPQYIYVLVDDMGNIIQTSTTGNFDFSCLTIGTYEVYGFSYIGALNNPLTIEEYFEQENPTTITDIINDSTSGEFCLDIDNGTLTNYTTTVEVIGNPTINDVTFYCCATADNSFIVDATGIEPLEYSIDGTNYQTSNFFENVSDGAYTLYVRHTVANCTETREDFQMACTVASSNSDGCTILLGDTVYEDTNGNGIQDIGEPGVSGATVTITWYGPNGVLGGGDDVIYTETTDANGNYIGTGLMPGNYSVSVTAGQPVGSIPTENSAGITNLVLNIGDDYEDADFGFEPSNTCDANPGSVPTDPLGCQAVTNDIGGTTGLNVLSYDFNNSTDFTQVYFITDGTDVIEAISVPGTGGTPVAVSSSLTNYTAGDYVVYVINYDNTDGGTNETFIAGLTTVAEITAVATTYTTGDCMIRAENAMTIEVCDPICGCANGATGTIQALTSVPGSYNTDISYDQTYLLTNTAGLILDIQGDANFTGLTTGDYQVYSLNHSNTASENPLVDNGTAWTAITANTTTIADLSTTPGLGDACFSLVAPLGTITVDACPTATIVSNNSAICDTEDAIFTVNGTSGATLTYTITGQIGEQTLALTGVDQTITAANVIADATLTFVSVADADTPPCTVSLTNTSTVTVNDPPTEATVTPNANVCDVASEAGNDEGQTDLDALVTAGNMTGTWSILSGNTGGTATISGSMASSDVVFDAGAETGPLVVQYTLTGTGACSDVIYDVTINRVSCGVCAPNVGIVR